VKDQVLRIGLLGLVLRMALEWDGEDPPTVAVEGNEVRIHLEVARSTLRTPQMIRARLIRQYLR